MACGAVPRREALCGDDEGGSVGPEVKEELGGGVEGEDGCRGEVEKGETEDAEDDGEDEEAENLEGLAAYGVYGEDGNPVAGKGASHGKNNHSHGIVEEFREQVRLVGIADSIEDQ